MRSCTFKVLTPNMFLVSYLIDFGKGEWNVNLVTSLFFPVNIEIILSVPLRPNWPRDTLTSHHCASRELTVKTSNTIVDMIMELREQSLVKIGDFISTIWTCWDLRNNTLFRSGHSSPSRAFEKASELDYLSASLTFKMHLDASNTSWKTPDAGLVKMNFDGGKLHSWGKGWGVVGRISTGAILFAAVKQSTGFTTPELEEVNACLSPIHQA
ncbi:LOW QUALITY PROTEIN: hypothetical protein Cgig2_021842 [Carnegiea gigantea]|uniref:RNase H type-1 domain-containing protein n=1 Tax=Carnegiea gigantea TaxID=171969 RepID=A0A9Q1Q4D6_9CARY|nr:LOW QUALITY PROTEIN: hypothetical protein Cgig2_021842 [Carnegiea gigantea]